ncbi:MAG: hypothetical protein WBP64_00905 [Nitrososphaeraceae archaeon]
MDTIGGEREGAAGIRTGRKKDPAKQYDEKDAMSLAKIKKHEPTAVSRDPSHQKITEVGEGNADIPTASRYFSWELKLWLPRIISVSGDVTLGLPEAEQQVLTLLADSSNQNNQDQIIAK